MKLQKAKVKNKVSTMRVIAIHDGIESEKKISTLKSFLIFLGLKFWRV